MALSPVLAEQTTYPFVRLEQAKREAAARGVEIIDFGQGDPREPTDPIIRQALTEGVAETMGYPKAEGLPELRAAIAGWVARRFGVELDQDRELIPTLGSKEAIFSFAQVFADVQRGKDTALVPDPAYPVYERGAEFAGARIVRLPLLERNGFLPDLKAVDAETLDRTALVWVNYPNNPTAASAPRSFFAELAELAARHDFLVCSDEAYSELWFDEPPASALELRGSLAGRGLQHAQQALVDDRLPVGVRCGAALGDRRAAQVPAVGRHRAPGIRPARFDRRLG